MYNIELKNTLDKLQGWKDQIGEISLFYYKFRGNVRADVHLDDGGRFINSKGTSIVPQRTLISEIIESISSEIKKKEAKEEQLGIF